MHKLLPSLETMLKGVAIPQSSGIPQLQPSSPVKFTPLRFCCKHIQREQTAAYNKACNVSHINRAYWRDTYSQLRSAHCNTASYAWLDANQHLMINWT